MMLFNTEGKQTDKDKLDEYEKLTDELNEAPIGYGNLQNLQSAETLIIKILLVIARHIIAN